MIDRQFPCRSQVLRNSIATGLTTKAKGNGIAGDAVMGRGIPAPALDSEGHSWPGAAVRNRAAIAGKNARGTGVGGRNTPDHQQESDRCYGC